MSSCYVVFCKMVFIFIFKMVFGVFGRFLKVFEGHEATKSGSEGCWSDSLTINRHFIDIIDLYQALKYRFSKVFKGF